MTSADLRDEISSRMLECGLPFPIVRRTLRSSDCGGGGAIDYSGLTTPAYCASRARTLKSSLNHVTKK